MGAAFVTTETHRIDLFAHVLQPHHGLSSRGVGVGSLAEPRCQRLLDGLAEFVSGHGLEVQPRLGLQIFQGLHAALKEFGRELHE